MSSLKKFKWILTIIVVIVVQFIQKQETQVEAVCCHRVRIYNCSGDDRLEILCPDCTKPTPYCGLTSCNLFGCDCGDCRSQKNHTRIDNLELDLERDEYHSSRPFD